MSEPKFTGVWIPAGVFQTQTVSLTAKVVYGVVDALDNDAGCFASNAYLSKHLGLGVRQLQAILADLEVAGLVIRIEEDGRRVIRTVEKVALQKALIDGQVTSSTGGAENCRGGMKKTAGGGCRKLHTYSKVDNKVDKDTGTDIPWTSVLPFESQEFSKMWIRWIDYRKELKKPLKDATVTAQWAEFKIWGEEKSVQSIQESIKNGWQGLFEPKKNQGTYRAKPLTSEDHNTF